MGLSKNLRWFMIWAEAGVLRKQTSRHCEERSNLYIGRLTNPYADRALQPLNRLPHAFYAITCIA